MEKPKWMNEQDWIFIENACGDYAMDIAESMRDFACDVRDGRITLEYDDEN